MTEHCVYGLHALKGLLENPQRKIELLYLSRDRSDEKIKQIETLARGQSIRLERLSNSELNQRFRDANHQGVVAVVKPLPQLVEADLVPLLSESKKPCLILILDGVTDPHNLGACLRSADAAGVDFVVIPKDKNVSITPVVSKVACGAAEMIPVVQVINLARAIEILQQEGVWVYGAAGEATESLYQLDCTGNIAVVMGGEGDGLRRLTRERCDGLFSLPMQGCVESLNVSVATGVTLYEILRQRMVNRS